MTIDTPAWVRDAVFYQVFPDRFARSDRVAKPGPLEAWDAPPTVLGIKGGDLLGVVEHLDHIQALGATALYLNPIFQSASNHRYHTYDYFEVDPILGGNAALRELLDACHARGMRVVLDGVFNHASRGFWPFHHVMEAGKASPYRDWFYFHEADLEAGRPVRAYATDAVALDAAALPPGRTVRDVSLERLGYEAWWGLPALPKLNVANPGVRAYLLDVAEHWLRFGADGWRLDVPEEVPDDFWREFRRRVKGVDPDTYIVGEIWHEKPQDLRGDMYDALMNYPLGAAVTSFVGAGRLDRRVLNQHFTIGASVRDEDAGAFAGRLERAMTVYEPAVTAVQLNLLDSHDTPRFLSMVSGDASALRLATLILMTLTGAPTIYYGDEVGMRGEHDPANRGGFPWDDRAAWDRSLFDDMAWATALRHANPVLRHGSFRVVAAQAHAIAYLRDTADAAAVVIINAGDGPEQLSLTLPELDGWTLTGRHGPGDDAGWVPNEVTIIDGRVELEVPARSGLVLITA